MVGRCRGQKERRLSYTSNIDRKNLKAEEKLG
jgi:hypothetical protein